ASEWRRLFHEAGLAIEHDEAFRKARDFESWIGRMPVDAATRERVRGMLVGSRGGMREFLRPEGEGGALRFYLEEILILGRRA
ncbi:MAG TPA: hypothetical protein VE326_02635, partial [Candidatus Binatia bacterium]|nr:hypothetical protein [Candidatus Binatia bacterium]